MNGLLIDSYRFGEIVINGNVFRKDVIIFRSQVLENWRRKEGHSLCIADLEHIISQKPAMIIVGQGANRRMNIPGETQAAIEAEGVQFLSIPTSEACELYNELEASTDIAAALHLTC